MSDFICKHCGSSNMEYRVDDYDYDGNDHIWTWDIYLCLDCGNLQDENKNNPYEGEDDE